MPVKIVHPRAVRFNNQIAIYLTGLIFIEVILLTANTSNTQPHK